jgi:Xylose isomerase-like TIM barrel
MKLACASGSFHRDIERGELTQLEFLDVCARELACDGVVLDVRHFPRTDGDYLAQVKKMATDRGLSIAALSDHAFFTSPPERMAESLERALELGAPLLAAPLASEVDTSWTDQLALLGHATAQAKARNVTLALRNVPGTFAATAHDCKRVAKEADSAWLRLGPEPQRLDAASDPRALAPNTVLLWSDLSAQTERSIVETIDAFADFRGHLVLDEANGSATAAQLAAAIDRWRRAILDRK